MSTWTEHGHWLPSIKKWHHIIHGQPLDPRQTWCKCLVVSTSPQHRQDMWVWVKIRYPNNWMVNTTLDIHICGPLGLLFWPTSMSGSSSWGWKPQQHQCHFCRLEQWFKPASPEKGTASEAMPSGSDRLTSRITSPSKVRLAKKYWIVLTSLATADFNGKIHRLGRFGTNKQENYCHWRLGANHEKTTSEHFTVPSGNLT